MIEGIIYPFSADFSFVSYGQKPKSIKDTGKRFKIDTCVNVSVCRKCGCEIDRQHEWCQKCYKKEIS